MAITWLGIIDFISSHFEESFENDFDFLNEAPLGVLVSVQVLEPGETPNEFVELTQVQIGVLKVAPLCLLDASHLGHEKRLHYFFVIYWTFSENRDQGCSKLVDWDWLPVYWIYPVQLFNEVYVCCNGNIESFDRIDIGDEKVVNLMTKELFFAPTLQMP